MCKKQQKPDQSGGFLEVSRRRIQQAGQHCHGRTSEKQRALLTTPTLHKQGTNTPTSHYCTDMTGRDGRPETERTGGETRSKKMSTKTLESSLLEWSDKQSHILSGGGRSSDLYQPPLFPFEEGELPHYHKARGSTHEAFRAWHRQGTGLGKVVAGAWRRPLFVGGWTHSDDTSPGEGETTFNLQTPSVFIDMRVPKASCELLGHHRGFDSMTDFELRLFARRHAFAGYTRVTWVNLAVSGDEARALVATRHHAIDWNYVGAKRPRPNKWRVEIGPDENVWKEWGFAKDEYGQHVYMERWQRLSGGRGPFLALRRRPLTSTSSHPRAPDALLVVCGDHFGIIVDRPPHLMIRGSGGIQGGSGAGSPSGLVGLVDASLHRGDRKTALEFLSLESSHGRVSGQGGGEPWVVDCSLHPWLEGRRPLSEAMLTLSPNSLSLLWQPGCDPPVGGNNRRKQRLGEEQSPEGSSGRSADRCWTGASLEGVWDVIESTLEGPNDLETLLRTSGACVVRGTGRVEDGIPGFLRAKI